MDKIVYLSGAMGCYKDSNYPSEWRMYAERRLEEDFDCFNPVKYFNYSGAFHKTEKEIMRYELNKVAKSTVLLVNLKDIDKSIGTSDEILYAYMNHIPIVGFLDTVSNEEELSIHPWKIEQLDRIETGENAIDHAIEYILYYYS